MKPHYTNTKNPIFFPKMENVMNERIKELSKQAHLVADATYAKAPDSVWLKEYNKKFAELIVQECIEQVWYTREDGINGNVSKVIKDRIKEHFGVEEK